MPPISLLIKPASSLCNLRCKYCFYHSIAESRMTASYGIMNTETLEILIKKAMEYADINCTIAFQGGEPTLAGLDYFRKTVEFVEKYNVNNVKVNYALQTNGIVINEDWAKFLADNNFLVGISLDGPKDIHDSTRLNSEGKGSFNRVMNTVSMLNKYQVEYNILCVVNSYTARHAKKVYNFFKKHNFKYLQFIQCLDPLGEKPGGHEYSLTPEKYSYFLRNLFDEWYKDIMNGQIVSIRYFDNLVGMLMGYPPESCGMSGVCTAYFMVEADGGVYPCDFYVIEEWLLGNVRESGFAELQKSERAKEFVELSKHIDTSCYACEFFRLCRGGCRRMREPFIDGKPALNYYCQSYKDFFRYAGSRLREIAYMLSQKRNL